MPIPPFLELTKPTQNPIKISYTLTQEEPNRKHMSACNSNFWECFYSHKVLRNEETEEEFNIATKEGR